MNMVFRGIILAVMLMLAASSRASLVVFAFTNSSTGMLDTNVYRLTPRSNIQNADGTWNTKGPTVQYQNPTGYATNWLVPNNYLVTNPATGFWESIRVNDSSSNLVWAGNISLGQNANPFVNLVYNPSIAPGTNITFATNGNVITIASTGGGGGAVNFTNGFQTTVATNGAGAVHTDVVTNWADLAGSAAAVAAVVVTNNQVAVLFGSLTLTDQQSAALNLPNPFVFNQGGSTVLNIWTNQDVFFGFQAGIQDAPPAAPSLWDLNTGIGAYALNFNTTGLANTALGSYTLQQNRSGWYNTAVGANTLSLLGGYNTSGGSNNIAIGFNAGSAFLNSESSNIDIGNVGVAAENNIIRIGAGQSDTYLTGVIHGNGAGLTNISGAALPPMISVNRLTGSTATIPNLSSSNTVYVCSNSALMQVIFPNPALNVGDILTIAQGGTNYIYQTNGGSLTWSFNVPASWAQWGTPTNWFTNNVPLAGYASHSRTWTSTGTNWVTLNEFVTTPELSDKLTNAAWNDALNAANLTGTVPLAALGNALTNAQPGAMVNSPFIITNAATTSLLQFPLNHSGSGSTNQIMSALSGGFSLLDFTGNYQSLIASNITASGAGQFNGNGSGLTSIPAAQLTGILPYPVFPLYANTNGSLVTDTNFGGFTAQGSAIFTGNGGGLTNLNASALSAALTLVVTNQYGNTVTWGAGNNFTNIGAGGYTNAVAYVLLGPGQPAGNTAGAAFDVIPATNASSWIDICNVNITTNQASSGGWLHLFEYPNATASITALNTVNRIGSQMSLFLQDPAFGTNGVGMVGIGTENTSQNGNPSRLTVEQDGNAFNNVVYVINTNNGTSAASAVVINAGTNSVSGIYIGAMSQLLTPVGAGFQPDGAIIKAGAAMSCLNFEAQSNAATISLFAGGNATANLDMVASNNLVQFPVQTVFQQSFVVNSNTYSLTALTNGAANFSTVFGSSNGVPITAYCSNGVAFIYYIEQGGSGGVIP